LRKSAVAERYLPFNLLEMLSAKGSGGGKDGSGANKTGGSKQKLVIVDAPAEPTKASGGCC
jgi:hypothetical protein